MRTLPFNASKGLELEGHSLTHSVISNKSGLLIQSNQSERIYCNVTVIRLNGRRDLVGLLPFSLLSTSTAHKVVHTGILSCGNDLYDSIIHFYWMLHRIDGEATFKSSTLQIFEME